MNPLQVTFSGTSTFDCILLKKFSYIYNFSKVRCTQKKHATYNIDACEGLKKVAGSRIYVYTFHINAEEILSWICLY